MSKIEWTQQTWNPVTGCTAVSEGCRHCYAAAMSKRLAAMGHEDKYGGLINSDGHFNGKVKLHDDVLERPIRRGKPTMYFVNSMSDLFHQRVPFDFIDKVWATMAWCSQHTFQVLTKRPARAAEYMSRFPDCAVDMARSVAGLNKPNFSMLASVIQIYIRNQPDGAFPNIWFGTSVEDSDVLHRIEQLKQSPAAVRFLSCEPLIGPIDLAGKLDGIDWVIVGGESGPKARPCDLTWIHSIVRDCTNAGVPVFVKQLGSRPVHLGERMKFKARKGNELDEWADYLQRREMPEVTAC